MGGASPTLYVYDDGAVVWSPGTAAKLAMVGVGSGSFDLAGGLTLPANTDLAMGADTSVGAVTATGGALTFFTPCRGESNQPTVAGIAAGSTAFRGGNFAVSGTVTGAAVVEQALGQVAFTGSPALGGTLTIIPPEGWKSSDEKIASVGPDGLVTALAAGTAAITATTTEGGLTATCTVTVTQPTPPPSGGGSSSSATDKAVSAIEGTKNGDTVKVDLPSNGKLPSKVLEAAAGKDVTLEISATRWRTSIKRASWWEPRTPPLPPAAPSPAPRCGRCWPG